MSICLISGVILAFMVLVTIRPARSEEALSDSGWMKHFTYVAADATSSYNIRDFITSVKRGNI